MIMAIGKTHKILGDLAARSFKAHHPDIDLIYITEENAKDFNCYDRLEQLGYGYGKIFYANEIMQQGKYDKIINLGADTITCARLDEFLDDDSDMVATLDYNLQLNLDSHGPKGKEVEFFTPIDFFDTARRQMVRCPVHADALNDCLKVPTRYISVQEGSAEVRYINPEDFKMEYLDNQAPDVSYRIPVSHCQLNGDVVCFSKRMLEDMVISLEQGMIPKTDFSEQLLINIFAFYQFTSDHLRYLGLSPTAVWILEKFDTWWQTRDPYKISTPEAPFPISGVSYNVRTKATAPQRLQSLLRMVWTA